MSLGISKPLFTSLGLSLLVFTCFAQLGQTTTQGIGVLTLKVDGEAVKLSGENPVQLSPYPDSLDITYGLLKHGKQGSDPVRIRFKLDQVDSGWREQSSPASRMRLWISFLDDNGSEVQHVDFSAVAQSAGWTGSFETSRWLHRRETIVVPPKAKRLWLVISSAGGPETIGAFFVGNLTLRALDSTNHQGRELFKMDTDAPDQGSDVWRRDGLRTSMAKIIRIKGKRGLAIVDDDPNGHAQWNTLKGQGPPVNPADLLELEWDEMFSIGVPTPATVSYQGLQPGFYRFGLQQLSVMGLPTGEEVSMGFEVLAPFWKTPWFWVSMTLLVAGVSFGGWRYVIARQLRIENARLAQQQLLEAERFRIARDIHDDLGARVTQISLLSSAAQQKPEIGSDIRQDLALVTELSRNLVGALYETVWAVSPENDHLDSLGTYICQMANQMCEPTGLKCRLSVPDLPRDVAITSSARHNLVMTVKESIHNIIKHAGATEVMVNVQFNNGLLVIEVKDNGKGFDPLNLRRRNGLLNMERRMNASGGKWIQTSRPGEGTVVRLELRLSENGGTKGTP